MDVKRKNKFVQKVNSSDRKRLLYLSLGISLLFSVLISGFYQIQIVDGEKWSREADRQHYFFVKEPFMRGTFLSNMSIKKGHPEVNQSFVIDVQRFHLYVDPKSIPQESRMALVQLLNSVLHLDEKSKQCFLIDLERPTRNRKLKSWLSLKERELILAGWYPFAKKQKIPRNALFFVSDYQRSYPFGSLLGQVLHTIQDTKDEKTTQAKPTGGVELYFNQYLEGKLGKRRLMRSPRNALETGEVISSPQNGAIVHLTINHDLQAIAEEEIAKGVINSKAKSGWAVMMDPYTGEIWALAQYPSFEPRNYQDYFNDPQLIEHTKVKAITDANEPGSIIKPITIAVALKANEELEKRNLPPIFDPAAIIPTFDSRFAGRSKPLKDTHLHKYLNMQMAIQKSSNIYVARLAEKIVQQLGGDWYRKTLLEDFGLGMKTGVELPAESRGVLPKPGKKHANGTLEWSKATPYVLAIGHNIQATSLQILRAHAIFANGGYLVHPTLVRKIVREEKDGSKSILLDHTSEEWRNQFLKVMSEKHAKDILTAMKFTTKVGGTARRADIPGYTEAGKTGTGDKAINGIYRPQFVCSSFVGVAPATKPVFVLIVTIDEPEYGYDPAIGKKHHGGTCCAPVFREIGRRTLEYLGIPEDDPFGYPYGDSRRDPSKADWFPEIRQLQEMYEKWNM